MRPARQNTGLGNSVPSTVTPTTSERLPDGTILQYVRVNGESRLLIWRQGQQRVAERFASGNLIYEPMSLNPTVLEAVRFPGDSRVRLDRGTFRKDAG